MNSTTLLIMTLLKIPQVGMQTIKKFLASDNPTRLKFHIDQKKWEEYLQQSLMEIQQAQMLGIKIISYMDEEYPKRLLSLTRFPVILYARGNLSLLNVKKTVAVIGTRSPSNIGQQKAIDVLEYFLERDYVIVSGLAKGCDTIAHQVSLDKGGKTIAVLAKGLDQTIYPVVNTELAMNIVKQGGLLLSTYPLGTKLKPQYLAARDEWQSGLSAGVVVIETKIKSGTNLTVNFAIKQKRPVGIVDDIRITANQSLLEKGETLGLSTLKSFERFENSML